MSPGSRAAGLAAAGAVLDAAVREGVVPGVVAAAGVGDREWSRWIVGSAELGAATRPMAVDTVFDLASLTKVTVTLPAVLRLVADGRVGLDEPLARFLPGVAAGVTVRGALTHTAGLLEQSDFTATVTDHAGLVAAAAQPLRYRPGTRVAYSDLGFILLGGLVEAVTGTGLAEFARAEVLAPIGSGIRFRPPSDWLPRIAATEVVPDADGVPRAVVGRVHDENASAAGGVAGHAGAFGTLADLVAVVHAWLPGVGIASPVLPEWLRDEALRAQTAGLGGSRGLGWTARGDAHDILGPGWGPAAVSHTGFTGTSLALDPATGRWAVLLTNALHLGRNRPQVATLRRDFHACLAEGRG